MKPVELKITRIGNSHGVRLPAATLKRYCIGAAVVMEERSDGILLRPTGPAVEKLSWEDTASAMPAPWRIGTTGMPMTDASHVKNALARFDQVEGVSDADRDQAFANIEKAAKHYGINVEENNWHELGKNPHTHNSAH